jgi:WD40 repeat protein
MRFLGEKMRPVARTLLLCVLLAASTLAIPIGRPVLADYGFEPIPANLPVITAQNAGQLRKLSTLRYGDFRYTNHRTTFGPDGRLLALAPIRFGLMTISILELTTGKQTEFYPRMLMPPAKSLHYQVVFSADGRLMATSVAHGAILIWEVATGKRIATYTQDSVVNFRFSSDAKRLVTIGENKVVRVWDIATGIAKIVPIGKVEGWHGHIISRPDGRLEVAFNGCLSGFKAWKVDTGEVEARQPSGEICTIDAISEDGSRLGVFRSLELYEIWDADKGQKLADIPFNNVAMLATHGLGFSADNKLFSSLEGTYEKSYILRLWDIDAGKQAAAYEFSDNAVIHAAAFSPDGRLISLEKYDLAAREMIVELWGVAN